MTMNTPFEHAVDRHGATVLRVCRAVLGPGPDADDAWSEAFLAALKSWPELPEDTNVEAWLVRVAHRKSIDITRARARQIPTDALPDQVATTGIPDAGQTWLWQALAGLPERQRLALAYHYFGGLSHVETAEITGSRPDAVRRAAADGIRKLRQAHGVLETPQGASR